MTKWGWGREHLGNQIFGLLLSENSIYYEMAQVGPSLVAPQWVRDKHGQACDLHSQWWVHDRHTWKCPQQLELSVCVLSVTVWCLLSCFLWVIGRHHYWIGRCFPAEQKEILLSLKSFLREELMKPLPVDQIKKQKQKPNLSAISESLFMTKTISLMGCHA